ncbi:MAG: ATPase domain-containing protein [Candidatus Margulisbacteria bacterium]|nr:ATPase domain-containing protein [Candidatus Margulisiibacteriota bacterium]
MIERVATGIEWFDALVQQGIPKHKVTLILGESGSGKTIFGLNYIRKGLFTDEHVAYITSKSTPQQILTDTHCLGWDLDWALEQNRLFIVDIKDYFANVNEEDLKTTILNNFFQELEKIIINNEIRRLVFDPVIPYELLNFKAFCNRYVSELINFLENPSLQVTSVLIHTENEQQNHLYDQAATNVIHMFSSKKEDVYKRTLLIKKMQNTFYINKEYIFDIIPDRGLVLTE